jgi:hypothetical protein
MKLKYVVFSPKIEVSDGDDSYYSYHVLGEWMEDFDTQEEAVEYIKTLNLKQTNCCIIMPIYTGE